jgi:hypothetical protein
MEEKDKTPVSTRTNRPGAKNKEMFKWEDVPYEKMEGPLAVEEYLQQLIRMRLILLYVTHFILKLKIYNN